MLATVACAALLWCCAAGPQDARGQESRDPGSTSEIAGTSSSFATLDDARELLIRVNDYRREHGLTVLVEQAELTRAAMEHARHMARRGKADHSGFQERFDRLSVSAGVGRLGENVGFAEGVGEDAIAFIFRRWLTSPAHRKNIEGDYQLAGVGVTRDANGGLFVGMLFGAKRAP